MFSAKIIMLYFDVIIFCKNPFSGTKKNFSDYEVQQILEGILPSGYTWHHNQKEGFMQLVETTIHNATGHTGGMSLWGVGYN